MYCEGNWSSRVKTVSFLLPSGTGVSSGLGGVLLIMLTLYAQAPQLHMTWERGGDSPGLPTRYCVHPDKFSSFHLTFIPYVRHLQGKESIVDPKTPMLAQKAIGPSTAYIPGTHPSQQPDTLLPAHQLRVSLILFPTSQKARLVHNLRSSYWSAWHSSKGSEFSSQHLHWMSGPREAPVSRTPKGSLYIQKYRDF